MKKWWKNLDDRWKIVLMMIPFVLMILYSSYEHRNDPNWDVLNVRIVK